MRKIAKFPKISIIVVNFNGLDRLKKTINPLLNLNYQDYELIVVDNGSTDGSIEYLKENNLNLILSPKERNKGFAVNYAVERASGENILFLDNDILIKDKNILLKLINNLGSKNLISPILLDYGETKTKYYGGFFNIFGRVNTESISLNKIRPYNGCIFSSYFNGGIFFLRRIDWKKIGGYDDNQLFYLDDMDLGIRSWLNGYKIKICTDILAYHIGKYERDNLIDLSWKYKYYFSGYARTMMKCYRIHNLLLAISFFFIRTTLKKLVYSYKFKSFKPILSYFYSITIFLKNFKDTLDKRRCIQSNREVGTDVYLRLSLPPF